MYSCSGTGAVGEDARTLKEVDFEVLGRILQVGVQNLPAQLCMDELLQCFIYFGATQVCRDGGHRMAELNKCPGSIPARTG